MTDPELLTTPLRDRHIELGARMVPFAGYEMPIHYPAGIQAEHRAVRERSGLFDVSHMGEVEITGSEALAFIQHLTVNDASKLEVGQAQYSAMCNERGGVIDDLLVYRFADRWLLVVNASNRARDVRWMERQSSDFDVELRDRSDDTALIALQGPSARDVLARVTDMELDTIGYYRFREGAVAGFRAVISGTGYTGEDGFELYLANQDAPLVWDAILEVGGEDVTPAGLGARDSLRLEMGYALHGNDLDEDHTPLESALGWIVKLDKGPFVGAEAIRLQKEEGPPPRLVGLRLLEKGFPRPGYPVLHDGEEVGILTSGTVSPTLGVGIGLARLPAAVAGGGTEVVVRIRDRECPARIERPPFYTEGSIRR